ncbi:MAG: putative tRNA threonylcarbamoyladenosine biosynthesis protein Gcp [Microgenomates group bacterium GW2011_GWC1_39_7b]|uniref:tRNA N6-adenosine threonylcarbamoyltransferase n=2 Tax=Candidatus Woeseibacteriota TaxID=1752722 RepID=A0A0G0PS46_9BACT|nr:MAG: putative tRNA threonylcarbamoyladenosine biosynthesis protein Gcp [Candidatus Woesebacteria bacterium GW2011_GWB1_39_10]KKR26773.1 MAG: putative tRNA threonylcarbamoyladenosine biosynthesis protein Gcp [Microgenomates group bacterium GW2011_GWC1_39_7b]KKS91121.1 MAG: putative tRNA threonylcarbamoyladenosine biosynthesis protein Gcp [Candidatus Woesebacteria bacterium GW2011_GWA1_43_12]
MKILCIDTSCDETACAITENTKILSNIIWSQASAHAKFGGVMPSLAQRMHEERIDLVVDKAIKNSKLIIKNLDCIAVTVGPGLSIALGVGINKAKELALKYNKKLIPVNHLEAHVLSPLANNEYLVSNIKYPALGLVVSGGNTILVKINKIGEYETLAQTADDALGEALDKAARMLGLGYPGGAILEKFAKLGDPTRYKLPIPMVGQEDRKIFSYSGLKTSMMRKIQELRVKNEEISRQDVYDLAASFQNVAFSHLIRVVQYAISHKPYGIKHLLVGGGVSANIETRKRLRKLGKEFNIQVHFPYSKKLTGDNAAMIGVAAYFKAKRGEFVNPKIIDRIPNLKIGG